MLLFIGTYTGGDLSQGIHVYRFDQDNGHARFEYILPAEDPSFLTVHPENKVLYAVNELGGKRNGRLSAFVVDEEGSRFVFYQSKSTHGDHPCHIVLDACCRFVVISNYTGGSLCVYEITDDGYIGELLEQITYHGSGPDRSRQESPHIHSAFFSPDNSCLFVQDLGTDQIYVYDVVREPNGSLVMLEPKSPISVTAGGGPRHVVFSICGNYCYVMLELTANVLVLKKENNNWTIVQNVCLLDTVDTVMAGGADIKISPCGKHLYATNRGESNTISIFDVGQDGQLTVKAVQSSGGICPRHFNITPNGKYILVANQHSHQVAVFQRDNSGLLAFIYTIEVASPSCISWGR